MYKLLIVPALFFAHKTHAQAVSSLENKDHKLTLSVLKSSTTNVDLITVTATYYGNETDKAVYFVPSWNLNKDLDKCTVIFDVGSFDLSKPFKVVLHYGNTTVKTFELSKSANINGEVLSCYKSI